ATAASSTSPPGSRWPGRPPSRWTGSRSRCRAPTSPWSAPWRTRKGRRAGESLPRRSGRFGSVPAVAVGVPVAVLTGVVPARGGLRVAEGAVRGLRVAAAAGGGPHQLGRERRAVLLRGADELGAAPGQRLRVVRADVGD